MSARTTARIGAIVMAVLLVGYIGLVGWRAVLFIGSGEPVGIAIGVALVVLPVIAVWALWRELAFGVRSERLVDRLDEEDGLPEFPAQPSGRPDRAEATAAFDAYRAETEAAPESWRAWLRLGIAYDAAGDRRRARAAVRRAITLERASAPR
ncbi:hypothetical protein ARHIZOSPH14_00630 [Agromyces rhizosphaerae]|uniref:Tetratricopeptide repeat protein n=2 Tax=Agromyces rhizosphaerae TaxID=88374 RepID=A0A9W6CTJ3_9MICO|nr:hypothetical protein ARHIZOSPH14_00630 [Agromyces rhizosphaerae]